MTTIRIDFVSDVVCPWCAVGLNALERALEAIGPELSVDLHFAPFELNPNMAPEGEDTTEHLAKKYGISHDQIRANRDALTARGNEVGFKFALDKRTRIYNTFDAHRLLYWAGTEGKQRELKHALLGAYFTDGHDVSQHVVLADAAAAVGLDRERALAVLASGQYGDEVRAEEDHFLRAGIRSVPAVILNGKYLVSGGQPAAVFEAALRQLM